MPLELRLELIDLQANGLLKKKHREGKLLEFCRCLSNDKFLELKKFGYLRINGRTFKNTTQKLK